MQSGELDAEIKGIGEALVTGFTDARQFGEQLAKLAVVASPLLEMLLRMAPALTGVTLGFLGIKLTGVIRDKIAFTAAAGQAAAASVRGAAYQQAAAQHTTAATAVKAHAAAIEQQTAALERNAAAQAGALTEHYKTGRYFVKAG